MIENKMMNNIEERPLDTEGPKPIKSYLIIEFQDGCVPYYYFDGDQIAMKQSMVKKIESLGRKGDAEIFPNKTQKHETWRKNGLYLAEYIIHRADESGLELVTYEDDGFEPTPWNPLGSPVHYSEDEFCNRYDVKYFISDEYRTPKCDKIG